MIVRCTIKIKILIYCTQKQSQKWEVPYGVICTLTDPTALCTIQQIIDVNKTQEQKCIRYMYILKSALSAELYDSYRN